MSNNFYTSSDPAAMFAPSASTSTSTPPTNNNDLSFEGGMHQRKVSQPTTISVATALPTHIRDRSGGSSGLPTSGSTPQIFSNSTGTPNFSTTNTTNNNNNNNNQHQHSTSNSSTNSNPSSLMTRQTSQGIGISFDNSITVLNSNNNTVNSQQQQQQQDFGGTLSGSSSSSSSSGGGGTMNALLLSEEDEPPLLEELGIRPDHIRDKVKLVLNPLRPVTSNSHDLCMDEDLAGPLTFAMCLGFLLTLQGKIHFGAIYGMSVVGILLSYFILSMMSQSETPVRLTLVISTLGYCLLPDLVLALFSTLHLWTFGRAAGQGFLLPILCLFTVVWSAWCAMKIFAEAFNMHQIRFLILYPAFLFYATFAAITMF